MQVKFMWNGIKIDGTLFRAHYSKGNYTPESGIPAGTITVYRRDYGPMPEIPGLTRRNESDIMTDYFETDRIMIARDNGWYPAALAAWEKAEAHNDRRFEKRYGIQRPAVMA